MWFIVVGVLLIAMKLADFGFVASWSWWTVLSPFALALAWWTYADASGYTKRREMDKLDDKKRERRRKSLDALGIDRNTQKRQEAADRARRVEHRAGSALLALLALWRTWPARRGCSAAPASSTAARRRASSASSTFSCSSSWCASMVIESPSCTSAISAALVGLGRHVADHHAPGAAGEAAVGDQAHALAQALADQRAGGRQHLGHARAALGAEVAQHHHVAGHDLAWP
jgi:small Trp-rich protein